MQDKILSKHGKAVQTPKCPTCHQTVDKAQFYKDWIRETSTGKNGYWLDIDLIKVAERDGQIYPKVITDLTFAKSHEPAYLEAIRQRWFERDAQGTTFRDMAAFFGVPCYLVAYSQDKVSVLDVMSPDGWITYSYDEWGKEIEKL